MLNKSEKGGANNLLTRKIENKKVNLKVFLRIKEILSNQNSFNDIMTLYSIIMI